MPNFQGFPIMASAPTINDQLCHVLAEDVGLAETIPPDRREQALAECVAREVVVPVGRWSGSPTPFAVDGIGLLVLDGLLVRRVGVAGRFGAELLGEGDLLRPWDGDEEPSTLPLRTGWRVLQTSRLAILDEDFVTHLGDHPELAAGLVSRAVGRARNTVVNMAIVHHARVDVRLHMLFWHLAARWGRVGSGGVTVPLHLTHAVLAELAAARRPTVTSALTMLAKQGVVRPTESGWLLTGEPPGEVEELTPVGIGAGA
jgi:CRP/FNR family transcriptional regulator, cyclic AMP receptor protein